MLWNIPKCLCLFMFMIWMFWHKKEGVAWEHVLVFSNFACLLTMPLLGSVWDKSPRTCSFLAQWQGRWQCAYPWWCEAVWQFASLSYMRTPGPRWGPEGAWEPCVSGHCVSRLAMCQLVVRPPGAGGARLDFCIILLASAEQYPESLTELLAVMLHCG